MRTLMTGVGGMLAHGTLPLLDPAKTWGCDLPDCDITEPRLLMREVIGARPDLILHFAAYTDVDGAQAAPERAVEVNAMGTENVARAAAAVDALLVVMSTDYVFDGRGDRPYRESDPVNPLSVYGLSKLEGEQRALAVHEQTIVVRTAWLFGEGGKNFIDTIAGKLCAGEPVSVVDDQIGRPTYTRDLAGGILALVRLATTAPHGDNVAVREGQVGHEVVPKSPGDSAGEGAVAPFGVYHLTNQGEPASWFEVARLIAECVGADPALVSATTTKELHRPAPRPAYSVLDNSKAEAAGVTPLRDWREAVREHLGCIP